MTTIRNIFKCAIPLAAALAAAAFAPVERGGATFVPGTSANTGTLDIVGYPGEPAAWTVTGTRLDLTVGTAPDTGTLVAQGVGTTCWEGKMTFASSTQYVAIYRICQL